MKTAEFLDIATTLAALIACLCAVFVARRAKAWRDVDNMDERLRSLDHRVKNTQQGQHIIERKVSVIETRLETAATKADVARLEADVAGICRELKGVGNGVERIEQWLMQGRAA